MSDEGKSLFQQGYDDAVGKLELTDMQLIAGDNNYLAGYAAGSAERDQRNTGGAMELYQVQQRVGAVAKELGFMPHWFHGHVEKDDWADFMIGYNSAEQLRNRPEDNGVEPDQE